MAIAGWIKFLDNNASASKLPASHTIAKMKGQGLVWRSIRPLIQQGFEQLKGNYRIVCGPPETVLGTLEFLHNRLGMEHLIFYGQESRMFHDAPLSNIRLFGKEVLPTIQKW